MKKIIFIIAIILLTTVNAESRWIGCWTEGGKPVFYLSIEDKNWLAQYSLNERLFSEVDAYYFRTTVSEKTGNKFDTYKNKEDNIAYMFQRSVMKGYSNTLKVFRKGSETKLYLCEDLK